ncbi:MAG: hypothetical protein LIO94_12860 [Clostridiales bacterium]|nr:hypothetical protein [Clostridiales bacterium]
MKEHNDGILTFIRYFLLVLAIVLLIILGLLAFRIYQSSTREIEDDASVVVVEDTEAHTEALEEEVQTETEVQTEAESDIEQKETETEMELQTVDPSTDALSTEDILVIEGQDVTEEETDLAGEESTGIYGTLNSACNFRSAASYEDEDGNDTTICSYDAGTELELLEDLGGWSRVKINGVIGYVGSQFVSTEE